MAPHAAGLEHVSIFLFEPQPSFRSDRSDRFGSRRLQFASRKGVHGNRGRQSEHAQEPGRRQSPRRGARKEYFKLLEGQPMTTSLFEGIDTNWSRVANSESIAIQIRQIISQFLPADPAASVPELLKLRQAMNGIKDDSWVPEKKAELDGIIAACL